MTRSLLSSVLLATVACSGCTQPSLPVKKHSATRQIPRLQDDQVALATATLPLEPQPLPSAERSPALPRIKPYSQWSEPEVAAEAIGRIGAPAVPELRHSLASADPRIRLQAAEVLARVGSDAKAAVPDLIERLDDEDPRVRRAAARTLGMIGPEAAPAVPALMRSLLQPPPLPPE